MPKPGAMTNWRQRVRNTIQEFWQVELDPGSDSLSSSCSLSWWIFMDCRSFMACLNCIASAHARSPIAASNSTPGQQDCKTGRTGHCNRAQE
eukprot:scaffold151076_cov25-Tisochrysis_lutea.AAC.1